MVEYYGKSQNKLDTAEPLWTSLPLPSISISFALLEPDSKGTLLLIETSKVWSARLSHCSWKSLMLWRYSFLVGSIGLQVQVQDLLIPLSSLWWNVLIVRKKTSSRKVYETFSIFWKCLYIVGSFLRCMYMVGTANVFVCCNFLKRFIEDPLNSWNWVYPLPSWSVWSMPGGSQVAGRSAQVATEVPWRMQGFTDQNKQY